LGLPKAFALLDILGGAQAEAPAEAKLPSSASQQSLPADPESGVRVTIDANQGSAAPDGATVCDVVVSMVPPMEGSSPPLDVCCVVDVSGSMQIEATILNEQGGKESHGLSLLDIVKHAIKTVLETLKACDRLAIVAYSTSATITFPLRHMDPGGKRAATVALEALEPDGQTNLWDGIKTGLDVLHAGRFEGRLASVLVLTDGLPNVSQPAVRHVHLC